jgi:hypothetical protein
VALARHDAIRFTRFSALLAKNSSFVKKKSKTACFISTLEKKTMEIVRDAIVAVFRTIEMIAERKEQMSRPFGSTTHP